MIISMLILMNIIQILYPVPVQGSFQDGRAVLGPCLAEALGLQMHDYILDPNYLALDPMLHIYGHRMGRLDG